MANMSYCRFENTFKDLQDCYEAMKDKDFTDLSESEQKYRNYLVKLCDDIVNEFEIEEETQEED